MSAILRHIFCNMAMFVYMKFWFWCAISEHTSFSAGFVFLTNSLLSGLYSFAHFARLYSCEKSALGLLTFTRFSIPFRIFILKILHCINLVHMAVRSLRSTPQPLKIRKKNGLILMIKPLE